MKSFKFAILSILMLTGVAVAQNQLGVQTIYRKDGGVVIAGSTNNPTLVTTNLTTTTVITTNLYPSVIITTNTVSVPNIRNFVMFTNTNTVPINVYSDSNGSNLVTVVSSNGASYTEKFPNVDTTAFYLRNTGSGTTTALVTEVWGR